MKHYLGTSLRTLQRQKVLTILTVTAIALSVALVSILGTLSAALDRARIAQAQSLFGLHHVQFHHLDEEAVKAITADKQIARFSISRLLGSVRVTNENFSVTLEQFDHNTFEMLGLKLTNGRLPTQQNEIVLDEMSAQKLGIMFTTEKKISLPLSRMERAADGSFVEKEVNTTEFTLTGILHSHPATVGGRYGIGFTGLDPTEHSMPSNVFITYKDGVNPELTTEQWNERLQLQDWQQSYNETLLSAMGYESDESDGDLTGANLIMGGLVLLAACLVIYNIFQVSVVQRTRQFGMLRAIGAQPSQIRRSVITEALLLCLVGIPIGLLISLLSSRGIIGSAASVLNPEALGVESVDQVVSIVQDHSSLPWSSVGLAAALGLATTLLSAWLPAQFASRTSPIIALTGFTNSRVLKVKRRNSAKLVSARFFLWQTAKLNLKRSRGRTAVTVTSLTMAVLIFVTLQSFVKSFNTTELLTEQMDSAYSLSTEIAIADNDIDSLRSLPGVEYVRTARVYKKPFDMEEFKANAAQFQNQADTQSYQLEHELEVIGYDSRTLESLLKAAGNPLSSVQQMSDKPLALVWNNEINLRYDPNWKPAAVGEIYSVLGYEIIINGKSDKLAIHRNFTPLGTTLLMHEDQLQLISPESGVAYADIFLKEEVTPQQQETIAETLAAIKKSTPNTTLTSLESARAEIEQAMTGIRNLGYGLIALITIIGALGIINTSLTSMHTRRAELGTLRALGMSPLQMNALILNESLHYGVRALLIGLPIGISLSAVVMIGSRGIEYWRPPVMDGLAATLCALALCILSAWPSLARLHKSSIVESIYSID